MNVRHLLAARIDDLMSEMPGVRDGLPESVHDARVTTRRLREVLPLLGADRAASATRLAKQLGRQLGRLRDLDVQHELLEEKEKAMPFLALATASARRTIRALAAAERRELIRALEDTDWQCLKRARHGSSSWKRSFAEWSSQASATTLFERLAERGAELRARVEHATGVYFPNRLHRVRIAVKRLRYVVEIADELSVWRPPHLLRDLKKLHSTLGELRDAQAMIERMPDLAGADVPADATAALVGVLNADVARLHRAYLSRRERLLLIADVCERRGGAGDRRWHPLVTLARPLHALA